MKAYTLRGLEPVPLKVEARVSLGEGTLTYETHDLFQATEHSVRESRVRVQSAILRALGMRVTGHVMLHGNGKLGPDLDLAIALACLESVGRIVVPEGTYCRAELGFDGSLRPVRGTFTALSQLPNVSRAIVSRESANEALASGVPFNACSALAEALELFVSLPANPYEVVYIPSGVIPELGEGDEVFSKVRDAAIVGRHVLLLANVGGKYGRLGLARYYRQHMVMTRQQAIETMQVQSVAGILPLPSEFTVPLRAPHHTVSAAGLVGGGMWPAPGEVSIATNGLLVLDELNEFRAEALARLGEAVRVGVARVGVGVSYPAKTKLFATASKCPKACRDKCTCSEKLKELYFRSLVVPGVEFETIIA